MPQVRIVAKNFMDMVAVLPAMKLDKLYDISFICEAVLRSLPPLAKKYVLQMLFVDSPVTAKSMDESLLADGYSKNKVAIDRLLQLRVFLEVNDSLSCCSVIHHSYHLFLAQITAVVTLQLWTATYLHSSSWLKILTVAYFFDNLFLAIYELSHNLAFSTPAYNRWLGIFANLPIGVPMSITFQKYHLEHHRFQGVDGIDMDIPSRVEAHAVTNIVTKSIWVIFQLFFYALRPLFLKPKRPCLWEFINLVSQLALDVSLVYFWGWRALAYLILSTFVGGGMHPMAGHFISEHYVFNPDQETYSYYGPLNLMTWSVGYHNEHHDFPRIPRSRLYKLKEMAPEYYKNLKSYRSWSQVIYMYVMDRSIGPFSRMKRKPSKNNGVVKKDD